MYKAASRALASSTSPVSRTRLGMSMTVSGSVHSSTSCVAGREPRQRLARLEGGQRALETAQIEDRFRHPCAVPPRAVPPRCRHVTCGRAPRQGAALTLPHARFGTHDRHERAAGASSARLAPCAPGAGRGAHRCHCGTGCAHRPSSLAPRSAACWPKTSRCARRSLPRRLPSTTAGPCGPTWCWMPGPMHRCRWCRRPPGSRSASRCRPATDAVLPPDAVVTTAGMAEAHASATAGDGILPAGADADVRPPLRRAGHTPACARHCGAACRRPGPGAGARSARAHRRDGEERGGRFRRAHDRARDRARGRRGGPFRRAHPRGGVARAIG